MLRILWTILTHQPKSLRSNKNRKSSTYYDPNDYEISEFEKKIRSLYLTFCFCSSFNTGYFYGVVLMVFLVLTMKKDILLEQKRTKG